MGLSQRALAEKLFVSVQSVSKWERAEAAPDLEHLCNLSAILHVSVDDLLGVRHREEATLIAVDGRGTKTEFVLVSLFSRSFRPIGFPDFQGDKARKILKSLQVAVDKTVVVSFGSPYFGNQHFERAHTYVNAYSMLSPSVKAFVKEAMGEIEFGSYSPFELS